MHPFFHKKRKLNHRYSLLYVFKYILVHKCLFAISLPSTLLLSTVYITAEYGVVVITVLKKEFLKKLF